MQNDNSAECLFQLLKHLQIPVTRRGVYDELTKHPDYPSLLACSDVLHAWGVPNGAYKMGSEELDSVPTPFIAQMTKQGGDFRLIERVEIARITSSSQANYPTEFTPAEFDPHFTGNILIAEAKPGAGEFHYRKNRRKERVEDFRIPFVVIGCFVLFGLILSRSAWLVTANWHTVLLLFAKSTGLVLSILLLSKSLGFNSVVLQRVCESGSSNSCSAILNSSAAKLTEEISLAEVGFAYFASTWLALIVLDVSPSILQILALVSLLSLPFTLYSIYYQARVARQWCVLCCAVQAILWIEFFASATYITSTMSWPSFTSWTTLVGCIITPILGWVFVKPYLISAKQVVGIQQQLQAFKRNQLLFESAVSAQPRYPLLSKYDTIQFGNPTAQHIITVVSNPTCIPCAEVHDLLGKWLTRRDDVQVQIVFLVPDNPQDIRNQVASHLLALNHQNPDTAQAAMHNWYTTKYREYDTWASRYPVDSAFLITTSIDKHHSWCKNAAFPQTPTILLNGHSLPVHYELEDIQYFL